MSQNLSQNTTVWDTGPQFLPFAKRIRVLVYIQPAWLLAFAGKQTPAFIVTSLFTQIYGYHSPIMLCVVISPGMFTDAKCHAPTLYAKAAPTIIPTALKNII